MNNHPTFHTPSFGDEEFHIPQIQNNPLLVRGDVNVSGNINTSGGVPAVYQMTTTNINSSAADSQSALLANNLSGQWSMSNQVNMRSAADVVTLTGNDFLVLRSPSRQTHPGISGGDNMGTSSVHAVGSIDQTVSSDESDDNGLSKSDNRSPGGAAAIIDLKSKLKNDPNAPRKPVSAYALFFGDTQAAIKGQNPSASFAEISKIVASMWDVLAPEHKDVYKKKAEDAKKEYRRLISAYRANLLARSDEDMNHRATNQNSPMGTPQQSPAQHHTQPASGNVAIMNMMPSATSGVICISNPNQQPGAAVTSVVNPNISGTPSSNNNQTIDNDVNNPASGTPSNQTCIRNGCVNQAIVSPDWEDEYCSNECVVSHCAEIFSRWVKDCATIEAFSASLRQHQ